jgi:hypothetical protein
MGAGNAAANTAQSAVTGANNALNTLGAARDAAVGGLNSQPQTPADFWQWLQGLSGKSLSQIRSGG